nr:unnamed protein product [Callosobruchus chinensis]
MVLSMPGVEFETKIYFENDRDGVLALNFISGQSDKRHKYTDSEFLQAVSKLDDLNDQEKNMLRSYPIPIAYRGEVERQVKEMIGWKDKTPFFRRSYPIPIAYRGKVERQVKEMIGWKVIEPAQTEYVSPLVVVKKRDGATRTCLDARTLNNKM